MISRARITTVVLVISLALNLLIIGGITARIMNREARPLPPNLAWIMENLGEETKAELLPRMEAFWDSSRPLRRAVFRAQRQVNELVVQEPMDREAIAAAFEQLRQASMEYQKVSHAQATELFALLTPEQRVMALKFMQNRRDPERRERSSRDSSESRSP